MVEKLNPLEQLKQYTTVVADTGDFESIRQFKPQDATTNPTLIYKASQKKEYAHLVEQAVSEAKEQSQASSFLLQKVIDTLLVLFGCEILKIIPGRVSTEVDARYSFDTQSTIEKARTLIQMYEGRGISRERVLIKIASTWEGIQAAKQLQKESINCNLTLLFCLPQAVACAEAGVRLISPFVGRIYDWYRQKNNRDYTAQEDPGVESVRNIYSYYKNKGYATEIMGASFRNVGEIVALAGCDLLTISPQLLVEIQKYEGDIKPALSIDEALRKTLKPLSLDEKAFRWQLNQDAMATEKLAEGIRLFASDTEKLEASVNALIG